MRLILGIVIGGALTSASRPSGEWGDDDYDVLADGVVIGRIFKANAAPVGTPWMWTLAFGWSEQDGFPIFHLSDNAPTSPHWHRDRFAKPSGRLEANGDSQMPTLRPDSRAVSAGDIY
jgi:hypothetical protein